jgi:hypothetical protein
MTRTLQDVGRIVGAELDSMTAEFRDICWEVERKRMFGTFDCDGELYMVQVTECPDEIREQLGYPVRVYCWHCEERIIGKLAKTSSDSKHHNCAHCPTWEAGCLDEECGACE